MTSASLCHGGQDQRQCGDVVQPRQCLRCPAGGDEAQRERLATLESPDRDEVNAEGKAVKRRGGKVKPVRHQPHRTPTATQQARWVVVQQAREQGFSLRAIARNLGMARETVGKYLIGDSPPT